MEYLIYLLVIPGGLFLYWIYKCFVLVKEDQLKIVESYSGRYLRQTSGIRGKRAATKRDVEEANPQQNITIGDLIDGKENKNIAWIWYGLQRIPTYQMRKIVRKKSGELTARERELIVWGNPEKDTEVSILQISTSDHYRRQFTYEMTFENIETGRDQNQENVQNVKIRIMLNVTVCTKNAYQTKYREGDGGKWLETLHNVTLSCLNELCATKTFAKISDLRGVKLDDQKLSDNKTVKQRINEQILDTKHLGQETIDLDFLDYEIMEESRLFAETLQNRAIAAIEKETAKDKGAAVKEELKPIVAAKKNLMNAAKEATKDLYRTKNETVVEQTKALPKYLRVFAGNLYSPQPIQFDTTLPDTKEIIKESLAHDIADEIRDNSNKSAQKTKGR